MPDVINKKLEYINRLFIRGLHFKALNSIEDFKQKKDLYLELWRMRYSLINR